MKTVNLIIILSMLASTVILGQTTLAPDYDLSSAVLTAKLIVRGSVTETSSAWIDGPNGRNIYTRVRLSVEETIKGNSTGQYLEFRVMGGTVDGITQTVSDMATFRPKEEVVVLLYSKEGVLSDFEVLPGFGKLQVKGGSVNWANSAFPIDDFVSGLRDFMADPSTSLIEVLKKNKNKKDIEPYFDLDESIGAELLNVDPQGSPDLQPYQRQDWDDKLVISNQTGTGTTSSTIYDDERVYLDFGCWNSGDSAAGHYRYGLFIDGQLIGYVDKGSQDPYWACYILDAGVGPLSAGNHTFKVHCDYDEEVSESNETNNEHSRVFEITQRPPENVTIVSINPDSGSAGTETEVTIEGTHFGAVQGTGRVEFWWGRGNLGDPDRIEAPIVSWSDTLIVCTVPVAELNSYAATASSGPVRVITDSGDVSNEVTFITTFSYMESSWSRSTPITEVPYRINENTGDCAGEGAAIIAGANSWNNAGAALSFDHSGSHNNTDVGFNFHNDIMWITGLPIGVLARASQWNFGETILEADIAFNDTYNWSCDNNPDPGEYDIQSVTSHELGHWLSLRDLYGNIGDGENDIDKTMYGRTGVGVIKRVLHQDDIDGIFWIYGIACTPPVTGDWVITADCTMEQSAIAPANVIINENVTLTLASDVYLDIDFSSYHLKTKLGAKAILKSGAKIF
jgi:hypothetical protein